MKTVIEILRSLRACNGPGGAIPWVETQPDQTPEVLWRTCQRGEWLLWLAHELGVDRPLVVLASCDCVRPVLHLVPECEDWPRIAIETAEAWAHGEATLEEVRAAANDAYSAASAASAATAAYSAAAAAYSAAAYAADAYDNDAYSAASADYAADYAADAAAYAAADADLGDAAYAASYAGADARSASLRHSADLVRARIPWEIIRAKAWPEVQT